MRGLHLTSFVFLAFVASLVVDVAATEFRLWEDATGTFRTEAQFISLQGSNVQLKRKDGILILVPLDKLSRADQEFARRQALPSSPTGGEFPRAGTELPDWLVQDCPFNAREFWITVPSNQNAAPLYLDALYEFLPEVEAYFPREVRSERTPATKRRADRFLQLQLEWYATPQPKRNLAERDAVLLEHTAGFQKLAESQQRPSCVFEIGRDLPSNQPLLLASRQVIRVAQFQVERDIERGDLDSVVQMIDVTLRLSRDLRPRAPMAMMHMANALENVILENLLKPVLKSPALTTKQCDVLLDILVQHVDAVGSLNSFRTGLRGSYLSKRILLHNLQQHTGEFAESRYREAFGVPHETRAAVLFTALNGTPKQREGRGDQAQDAALMAHLNRLLPAMQPANFDAEAAFLKEQYEVLSTAVNQPYSIRTKVLESLGLKYAKELYPQTFAPPANTPPEQAVAHMAAEVERQLKVGPLRGPHLGVPVFLVSDAAPEVIPMTRLEGAKALVALRRWYSIHTSAPPDFATLCRAAGLTEVPRDYFSDGPLRMITFATDTPIQHRFKQDQMAVAGETIIYSVGSDGVDHKASNDWGGYPGPGDFLFRLEIPQNAVPITR